MTETLPVQQPYVSDADMTSPPKEQSQRGYHKTIRSLRPLLDLEEQLCSFDQENQNSSGDVADTARMLKDMQERMRCVLGNLQNFNSRLIEHQKVLEQKQRELMEEIEALRKREKHQIPDVTQEDKQEKANIEKAHQEEMYQEKVVQEKVIQEKVVQEKAIQEKVIQEKVVQEKVVQDKVISVKVIQEKLIEEKVHQEDNGTLEQDHKIVRNIGDYEPIQTKIDLIEDGYCPEFQQEENMKRD